jgi:hypothetical protein
VELFGSEYVIDHCVLAFDSYIHQKLYQGYVTDGLQCLSESIANYYGGSYLQKRFVDIIEGVEEEEVSADEIVLEIIEKAGLSVRGEISGNR